MNLNFEISLIFRNIAQLLSILNDNPFKIRAYNNASLNISNLNFEIDNNTSVEDLMKIEGIGKDLANKIIEYNL